MMVASATSNNGGELNVVFNPFAKCGLHWRVSSAPAGVSTGGGCLLSADDSTGGVGYRLNRTPSCSSAKEAIVRKGIDQ